MPPAFGKKLRSGFPARSNGTTAALLVSRPPHHIQRPAGDGAAVQPLRHTTIKGGGRRFGQQSAIKFEPAHPSVRFPVSASSG